MRGRICYKPARWYADFMATTERKLREARKRIGMTQGDLAQALGVTQGTISRWEAGSQAPDFHAVMKLARLADIDPSYFVADNDHNPSILGSTPDCKIVGSARQWNWVDGPKWEDAQHISVRLPMPGSLGGRKIEGYILEDHSAEPFFKQGSILFVDTAIDLDLPHESNVIIALEDKRGLFEITLKEVYINHKGAIYFSSLSQDPEMQATFKLERETGDDTIESVQSVSRQQIVGVVVASFRLE